MGLKRAVLCLAALLFAPAAQAATCTNPGSSTFSVDGSIADWNGICGWETLDPLGDETAGGTATDIRMVEFSHAPSGNATHDFMTMTLSGPPDITAQYEFRFVKGTQLVQVILNWVINSKGVGSWTPTVNYSGGATDPKGGSPVVAVAQNASSGTWNFEVGATKIVDTGMGLVTFIGNTYAAGATTPSDTVSGVIVDSSSTFTNAGPTAARLLRLQAFATGRGVELRWETGSEDGTLAFVVHRGASDGPAVGAPVAGLLDSMVGERYGLSDPAGQAGSAYYLEELATDGRHLYGPVVAGPGSAPAVAPKRVRAGPAPGVPAGRGPGGSLDVFARVDRGGLYRVDAASLAAFSGGRPGVPRVAVSRDGVAQRIATGPDGLLFYAPEVTATDRATDAYRILPAPGASPAGGHVEPPSGRDVPAASFAADVHLEEHHTVDVKAEAARRFPWGISWAVAGGPGGAGAFPFDAPGLAGGAAHLSVRLIGVTDYGQMPEHHARVSLNGAPLGELVFGGLDEVVLEADAPAGLLRERGNVLGLESVADTGVPYDVVDLAAIDLRYTRRFAAEGDTLAFTADGSSAVVVSGFSAAPALVDVTDPSQPVFLEGFAAQRDGAGYTLRFRDRRGLGARRYLAAVPRAPVLAASQAGAVPAGSADEVVLYGPGLGDALAPLLALRQAQGLSVLAVPAEAVYDAFGAGEHGTGALRRYLAQLQPSPKSVLLVGKPTIDPRDYMLTGTPDLLPAPLGLSGALHTVIVGDATLVAGADGVTPFAAVGRLPVESAGELAAVVAKLVAAETSGAGPSGLAVYAADDHDPLTGEPDPFFQAESDALAGRLGLQALKVYLPGQGNADLLAALAAGPDLVTYHGHADGLDWSTSGLLSVGDTYRLPAARPFFLVTVDCWDGMFAMPWYPSLAQSLVEQGPGGALAAFSASSLVDEGQDPAIDAAIFGALANPSVRTAGDLVLQAETAWAASAETSELVRTYNLIGDPASRLPLR